MRGQIFEGTSVYELSLDIGVSYLTVYKYVKNRPIKPELKAKIEKYFKENKLVKKEN